ncbi:hypothetical protein BpHYR1_042137 [Brachionus plicatilis]|uniref:Uncharacterized protein n=1 Tax=Brachionus plicatilis TaxID=10195 RepID=A0A3M7R2C6_BRAPC|nr:hypothetical protein BpHYR1_042137 [Brachionus plicatilis]
MAPWKQKVSFQCIQVQIFNEQINIEKTTGKIASYFGSVCNVLTENCIDFQNFEEFEVNCVIRVSIEANRKKYNLLARLLSKEILNEPPGIVISDIERSLTSIIQEFITTENEADRPTFSSVRIKPIVEQENEKKYIKIKEKLNEYK